MTLRLKRAPLSAALKELFRLTGVAIAPRSDVADEPVIVFASEVTTHLPGLG